MEIKNNVNNFMKSKITRMLISAVVGFLIGSSDIGCIRIGNDTGVGQSKSNSWLEINCDKSTTEQEAANAVLR